MVPVRWPQYRKDSRAMLKNGSKLLAAVGRTAACSRGPRSAPAECSPLRKSPTREVLDATYTEDRSSR
eukprot:5640014-Alexandrium_andersonii.AAC.1